MKFTASMRARTLLFSIGLTVGCAFSVHAQFSTLSPYSRFGLGDLYQGGNMGSLSLGGVRTTYNDAFMINAENPATLGSLINTSFQTGIRVNGLRLTQGDQSQQMSAGNLDQFQMAFKRPTSKSGFLFGMTPFSVTGYAITSTTDVDEVGQVEYNYEGQGGISKAFLGYGRRFDVNRQHFFYDKNGVAYDSTLVKKQSISFGANLAYYFGNVTQSRLINIQNTTFLGTRASRYFRVYDFSGDIGLHYEVLLKAKFGKDRRISERWLLQAAMVYTPEVNMKSTVEEYYESVLIQQSSVFPIDTSYAVEGDGTSLFPQRVSFGLALHYYNRSGRHLMLAADYDQRDWSLFRSTIDGVESDPGLTGSSTISLGVQYTPRSIDEGNNIFDRAQYRMGLRSTNTYLILNGQQLTDQALSAGVSIPLMSSRSASKLHFGMEFGARGVDEAFILREDYFNAYIGVTLSPFVKNAWFVERKYD